MLIIQIFVLGGRTGKPLGLDSYLGPVNLEWLYHIAPRIIDAHKPYHDDNLGTQSAGESFTPVLQSCGIFFDCHPGKT